MFSLFIYIKKKFLFDFRALPCAPGMVVTKEGHNILNVCGIRAITVLFLKLPGTMMICFTRKGLVGVREEYLFYFLTC